jgi:uncharacterized protein
METSSANVVHDERTGRFQVEQDGIVAYGEYRREDNTLYLLHMEVPEAIQGNGIGTGLAQAALEFARENRLRVVPHCPFMATFIGRNRQYEDLVEKWPSQDLRST